MKKLAAILICAVLLTACAPVSRPEPEAPVPEQKTPAPTDSKLSTGMCPTLMLYIETQTTNCV
jgi:PBP1b-binding outer membrane lipoprotein LpoB